MGKSNSSIWVSLGLNTDKFSKGTKNAKSSMNSLKSGLSSLSPVSLGVAGAIAGIGAVIGSAIKTFVGFEKANSELKAVLGASGREMAALSTQAKKLGSATSFTASQVTSLQTSFAKLGFDSTAIQNMTESTLAAAAALGSDLGEQATLTGATLASFGLDSTNAARVNDVLAKSAASSALDFEKLSVALPIVGSVAKTMGFSLERTTAILGTLTNNGLDASSSATALRNILVKLASKGMTWEEAMQKINTSTNKAKTSFDLFGKTSVAAGVILAEQGVTVDELTKSLNNADDAAQDMADTMLNNLAGDITKAGSAWEGFILSLEDGEGAMGNAARSVTQGFTKLITGLKNLDLIWKNTFSGLADFTQKELERTLDGGWETETGVSIDKITKAFDKIPIDKIKGNAAEVQKAWVKVMGEDAGDATALFKGYIQQRINSENELVKSSKEATKSIGDDMLKQVEAQKKLTVAREKLVAVDKVAVGGFKSLIDGLTPKKPIPVMIPITPTLEVIGGSEGSAITGSMVELGNEAGAALSSSLISAAGGALAGLGAAIGSGEVANLGDQLTGAFAGLLDTFGQQLIQLGLAQAALALALSLGPMGAGVAIGAGVALIAAAAAIKSSQESSATGFANGGLVTGSVFGNVGEGKGTSKSNPELIMPVDRLQKFLDTSGGNGMGGEVVFRIQGQELVGILNRQNKVNKFS